MCDEGGVERASIRPFSVRTYAVSRTECLANVALVLGLQMTAFLTVLRRDRLVVIGA